MSCRFFERTGLHRPELVGAVELPDGDGPAAEEHCNPGIGRACGVHGAFPQLLAGRSRKVEPPDCALHGGNK